MKPIRHVNQLGTRVREQGRLRMGVKTARAMKALMHWRFTSPEEEPLQQLAAIYGGTVQPWSDSKASQGSKQFELLSTSSKIRVFVPPGGLSTWYELWAGGGVQRRCDGEVCFIDGDDQNQTPCICNVQQKMMCKPKTRLSVVLPEISPFGGVWRLDTGSWNAADELAAMEQMLDSLQVTGLVEASLLIEPRQRMVKGQKKQYVVPVLLISASAQKALASGQEGTLLIDTPAVAQLPAPSVPEGISSLTESDLEDDVVDAQIVDEPDYDRAEMDERLNLAVTLLAQRTEYSTDELYLGLALGGSGGNHESIASLSDSEHRKAVVVAEQIAKGQRRLIRIEDNRLILG